uniref:RBR-type E3 ubiquitin transferase n=3 Tax=Parascaris univalens TaxID=6257 RepID=A0A915B430_PARUN
RFAVITMDDLTEEFPFDDRKKSSTKGKWKSQRRTLRNVKNNFTIVKTINAKNIKDEKTDAATEDLYPGIVYSMNRRERWNRLSADNVLNDAATKNISVGVLERWNTGKEGDQLASAYHRVSDGCITTRKANHLSASANTLIYNPGPKHRGSRAKRELAAALEAGIVDKQNEIPDITYSISRTHPSLMKWKIVSNKGPKATTKKRMKPFCDSVDEEDDDISEIDVEEENNENEAQRERIRTYDISEFVRQPLSYAVFIEAPSIETLRSTITSSSVVAPFELVTFPKEVREKSLILRMPVKVAEWSDFDFARETKELSISGQYSLIWLTRNGGSFAVDLTAAIIGHSQLMPHLIVIFEKPTDDSISIQLNGGFLLEIPRCNIIAKLLNSKPKSLTSMIESVVTCATNWRDREFYRSLKKFAMPTLKRKDVIEITEPFPYSRMYQSEMLLGTLNIIPFEKMVAAVCEEHEASRTKENFEVIGSKGEKEMCLVCKIVPTCGLCILDCLHGICSDCLRESITNQIRMGIFPVKCLGENCDCLIPHDFVRILVPVPLYVFYIKTTYICIKKRSNEEVRSCPLCLEAGVVTSGSYSSLCCSACATCFCTECEGIPHWPLTCEQFEEWTKKFDPQYRWEIYRLDGKLKDYLISRTCHCGAVIELPDNIGIGKCSACWLTYYWDTGKTNNLRVSCYYGKDEHGNHIYKSPEAKMVSQRKAPTSVNRLYAPQCALARRKRFDVPEMKSMVAAFNHQPFSVRQGVSATKLADVRNTALYILEYGTAWLFVNRLSPPENWKQIRSHLTKILSKLNAVTSRLSSRSDSDLCVQQFTKALDSLEATIAEIISMFRISV